MESNLIQLDEHQSSVDVWANPRARSGYRLVVLGGGEPAKTLCLEALRYGVSLAWISDAKEDASLFPDLTAKGVDCFFSEASFVDDTCVEVDGQAVTFSRAVLVPSLKWYLPKIPGVVQKHVLTPDCMDSETPLPEEVVITGTGPQACALAQSIVKRGVRVRMLSGDGEILHGFPLEAAQVVRKEMESAGIELLMGRDALEVEFEGDSRANLLIAFGDKQEKIQTMRLICADAPMLKLPVSELKAAQISLRAQELVLDEHWRTTNSKVYALTNVRLYSQQEEWSLGQVQGLLQNALMFRRHKIGEFPVPLRVPTTPPIFVLGDSGGREKDADEIQTLRQDFKEHADLYGGGDTVGFIEVDIDAQTGRCLSALLVGTCSEELITQFCFLQQENKPITQLLECDYAQPGFGAVLRSLAYQTKPKNHMWARLEGLLDYLPGR